MCPAEPTTQSGEMIMQWNEAFPSDYLKATDIPQEGIVVRCVSIDMVDVNDDGNPKSVKPVITLEGRDKMLIVNQTNADMFQHLFGPAMEGMIGKQFRLIRSRVQFGRRWVDGIRVMEAPDEAA